MTTEEEFADLARLVFRTAETLRLSVERMEALGIHLNGYTPRELTTTADSLHSLGIRCAAQAGDNPVFDQLPAQVIPVPPAASGALSSLLQRRVAIEAAN